MTSADANPRSSIELENFGGNWSSHFLDLVSFSDNMEQRPGTLHSDIVASGEDLGGNSAVVTADDFWKAFFAKDVEPGVEANAYGSSPQALAASNSDDQAFGLNLSGEGEESLPALTPAAQADLHGADKVDSSDDSHLLHGNGLGSDPKSGRHAVDQDFEESGVQESRETLDMVHRQDQRTRDMDWSPAEKTNYFKVMDDARKLKLRGKKRWSYCSNHLRGIRRTAKACDYQWQTSKKQYDAIRRHAGPCSFWDMDGGERSKNKLPQVFEKEWYDTMDSFYQKKRSNETRGITGHDSLAVGDGDGDEDLPGTKESQPAIEVSDFVSREVDGVVEPLSKLCCSKHHEDFLMGIAQQVKQAVGTLVYHEIKPALESQFLAKGVNVGGDFRNRFFYYLFKKHVGKEVESAFERSGITSFLLDEAQKELELQHLRERNRVLEKQNKSDAPHARHQGRPHGGKRPNLRTKA